MRIVPAAHGSASNRWTPHPWRARFVRVLAYGLPVLLSLGFVHLVTSFTGTPTSSLWIYLAWWLAVSLVATAVVSLVYLLSRRLLPLGALFELSLMFPDAAPSRFRLALQTRTVASLEERLRLMQEAQEAPTTQEAAEILLELVASLSHHDRVTSGHADRVRAYSHALGKQLGLGEDELDRLNWAALLHDIGKLEVSEQILNKNGPPSEEEWESVRLHPLHGETLVAPLREWLGEWIHAVSEHHERWDGTGYPRALSGQEISRAGRIVAIADAYDVITSSRSYKEPASPAEARAELVRGSGTQFDPRFVRAFVDLSLSRMHIVMGPVSWLSHAPLLARIPLSSVGASLGGAAAVATTATALAVPVDSRQAATLRPSAQPVKSQPALRAGTKATARLKSEAKRSKAGNSRNPSRTQERTLSPRKSPMPAATPDGTEPQDPTPDPPTDPEAAPSSPPGPPTPRPAPDEPTEGTGGSGSGSSGSSGSGSSGSGSGSGSSGSGSSGSDSSGSGSDSSGSGSSGSGSGSSSGSSSSGSSSSGSGSSGSDSSGSGSDGSGSGSSGSGSGSSSDSDGSSSSVSGSSDEPND